MRKNITRLFAAVVLGLSAGAAVFYSGGCRKSVAPVTATAPVPAGVQPGSIYPQLNLEVWNPGQTANTGKLAVRITNWGGDSVPLNNLSVKVWLDTARYNMGSARLVGETYGGNQSLYLPTGVFMTSVAAPSVSFEPVPPRTCGVNSAADEAVVITFTDAGYKMIPANGGYVETNSPTNVLAAWHASNWTNLDRSMDYSNLSGLGTSSASRSSYPNAALYMNGQLVCEYVHATDNPGDTDPATGLEPCGLSGCRRTVTPGPTSTPTATPTVPAGVKLNLEVWNPGETATEDKIAVRITNWGSQPVNLPSLTVKAWVSTALVQNAGGVTAMAGGGYANSQSLYSPTGAWLANLAAPSVSFRSLPSLLKCSSFRQADTEVAVSFTDAGKSIPPNGGYVQGASDTNALAAWHLSTWSPMLRMLDYSLISEAGATSAGRANLSTYALYYNGAQVCESLSASAADPASGLAPCGISPCPPVPRSPTPTPTPVCSGVYPSSFHLDVPLIGQQTGMWCWAASGEMCMNYLGHDVPQCVQANNEFGQSGCCLMPLCPTGYDPNCVQGGWPQFDKYGFASSQTPYGTALTYSQVQQQIACRRSPVAFSRGGHMLAAIGYLQASDGTQWVEVNDPLPECQGNNTIVSYDLGYVGNPDVLPHMIDFYDITYVGGGL